MGFICKRFALKYYGIFLVFNILLVWDSFLIQIGPWKCFVILSAKQSIVCAHQVWFQNELNMLPIYINRRPYHISVSWRNGVFGWWLICIFSSQTDTAKGRCQVRNVEGWICDTTSLSGGIPLVKIRNSFFLCGGTDRCVSFVIDIIVLSFSKRNLDNQGEFQLLHSLISTYFVVDMFFLSLTTFLELIYGWAYVNDF